jgi:NAD(P)-dependent dehydrogenase (short-subunit alcohol dehydrogenase family)
MMDVDANQCAGKDGRNDRRSRSVGLRRGRSFGKTITLSRRGEAEEVAAVIAFLASDAASDGTGACIHGDDGRSGVL